MTTIQQHIQDFNNPHQTTKAHVGLPDIQNYALATQAEVIALTRDDLYIDVTNMAWVQEAFAQYLFDIGLVDGNGDLITVPDDVGIVNFDIDQFGAASVDGFKNDIITTDIIIRQGGTTVFTQNDIVATAGTWVADTTGLVLDRFLEYRLIVSIFDSNDIMIGRRVIIRPADVDESTELNDHLADNNPHQVTKTHIGLGSVDNVDFITPQETTTLVNQTLTNLGLI